MHMNTNKTTKRIAYIANCKCCVNNGIESPEGYELDTINCPICGYTIEKQEWIRPDDI